MGSGIKAEAPLISALAYDDTAASNGWDVAVWIDVLTIPGTNFSTEFYEDLENWVIDRFKEKAARALPEWSKGWAYARGAGAWANEGFLDHTRKALGNNWKVEIDTLGKYDKFNIFTNPLLDKLFSV
jgi:hypothetical protein